MQYESLLFLGADPCEHICRVPPVHYFLQLSLQVRARLHELFQRAIGDLSHVARARYKRTYVPKVDIEE